MAIAGDVAILSGSPEGEYQFFAMHSHDRWACGKACEHEDRHDPGDMSKCYVRLEREGDDLRLSVRSAGVSLDPLDPDMNGPAVLGGSASDCEADKSPNPQPPTWATYVFTKK